MDLDTAVKRLFAPAGFSPEAGALLAIASAARRAGAPVPAGGGAA